MANLVVMELQPAEVEYLNSMWRCPKCDHLLTLHHEEHMGDVDDHCDDCEDQDCGRGLSFLPNYCLIRDCKCGDYD